MSPDELETLVLDAKDANDIRLAFEGMDEKHRKKLSTAASKLHKQLWEGKAGAGASERLQRHLASRKGEAYTHWNSRANHNAALAVFAVGPLSAVRKWQVRPNYGDEESFRQILMDRRPEWMDDWVRHELEAEWTSLDFGTVRGWGREGLIAKPTSDGYYRLFAGHLMRTGVYGRDKGYIPALSQQLLADPDLLDDIEGLFRIETTAFNTNSWLIKGAAEHYETWPQALVKLSAEGHYDRARLLDLALVGLQSDIKQNQLSGYHKFFRELGPTTEELAQRQEAIVALLCHPVGHVAKFAIDMLAKLEAAGALDRPRALRELPRVFAGDAKGNGIAALGLIDKIGKRGAKKGAEVYPPEVLSAAIEGLRHSHSDVQAKAIALLLPHRDALDEAQRGDIAAYGAYLAASNRAAHAELVGDSGAATAFEPAADAASDAEAVYESAVPAWPEWRVLSDANRLVPIASLQELIDAAFHCVETVDHADEVERLVDGIARMADQRPHDFTDRVAPLVHRIEKRGTGANSLAIPYPGLGEAMRALLLTWATGNSRIKPEWDSRYYTREDVFIPFIALINGVARSVEAGQARQILSAATHTGGFIDPLVWVERLKGGGTAARSLDLRLSMLRLAPDNRAAALETARDLGGDLGRIARFALGGNETPGKNDRKLYPSWITAARARDPQGDWRHIAETIGVDDPHAGGAARALYTWESRHEARTFEGSTWKNPILDIRIESESGPAPATGAVQSGLRKLGMAFTGRIEADWRELPSAAVNRQQDVKYYWASELNSAYISQWLYHVWPQHPEYAYYRAARRLMIRLDENASNWTPAHGLFQALFLRGRPWGEAGHVLLTLGLAGKDADAKGLATDALIEGVETSQFDPATFADVLARLSAGEWLKLNRLGETLKHAVAVSPRHAYGIASALIGFLPHFDVKQRGAFHILEVLVEAQAHARPPITDAAKARLAQLSGSSKAAKLAKQIAAA